MSALLLAASVPTRWGFANVQRDYAHGMYDLSRHPHFAPWTDPRTGAVSYRLAERIAPVQKHFYYTNPSVSQDGRWLWFACAFPPNPQKTLAVVSLDPDRPLIRHFPQAGFTSESPMVMPSGDAALFACGPSVWRLDLSGRVAQVATLPADYIAGRHLWYLATHLSLSADGRRLCLDGQIGNHTFLALADLTSGAVTVVKEFISRHDHAQFSPVDPEQILIAQDQWRDPISGRFLHHDLRVHLIRADGSGYSCLTPHIPCRPYHGACHEWWLSDGRVAYIEYDSGVWIVDPATRQHEHVWKEPLCHAHADASGRFWCADQSPYAWAEQPCRVIFFDRARGRTIDIASGLPKPTSDRGLYHLDPHPQFSPDGRWVVYTTTVEGTADVALSSVDALVRLIPE